MLNPQQSSNQTPIIPKPTPQPNLPLPLPQNIHNNLPSIPKTNLPNIPPTTISRTPRYPSLLILPLFLLTLQIIKRTIM